MSHSNCTPPRPLRRCLNVSDVKKVAHKKLPLPIRDYIDGGADDEVTLRSNCDDFSRYKLLPNNGKGIESADLKTTILGQENSWPVMLSPWGVHRLMHPQGELATSKAATNQSTIYTMSNFSTTSLEDVASANTGIKFFQLQPARDKSIMLDMIKRAKAAGYRALILTIDNPVHGNRERDARNGFNIPPKLSLRSMISMAAHPQWVMNYVLNTPTFANFKEYLDQGKDLEWLFHNLVCPTSWADVEWVRQHWDGPMAVKGILNPENAKTVVNIGCDGVIVSNQGARNFDGIPSSIAMLKQVVDAVDGKAEVILDGGIRRGTDVVKALAIGATACMTARPFVYGLASAGSEGVEFVIDLLKGEVERAMIVSGVKQVGDINSDIVRFT